MSKFIPNSYYRITQQLGTVTGTTYVSSVVPITAQGHNGYHLAISHVGSGTAPLKILIDGWSSPTSPWAHEFERGWVLSPQNSNNFQGFVTGYCPFPYMQVRAIPDAVTIPLSAQITIDMIPLDNAVPPVTNDGVYGTMANWNGTARHRVRGNYRITSGLITVPISGGNAILSMFVSSAANVRTLLKNVQVTAYFNGASGAAIVPIDSTARAVQLSYISFDPVSLSAITASLIRGNDTVMIPPLTTFRSSATGAPCSLDTSLRAIGAWTIPNIPGPPSLYPAMNPSSDEYIDKVLRPGQGLIFWIPIATVSGHIISVDAELSEQA